MKLNEKENLKSVTWKNFIKDYSIGALIGVGKLLVGHPFDTIKVRMIMGNLNFIDCIKMSYKNYGITSFYHGLSSPIISELINSSLIFGTYEFSKKIMNPK